MGCIVFLSRMIPEEHREWVEQNRIDGMFGSAIALQKKLLKGFDTLVGEELIVCNAEPIGNYPQHFRQRRVEAFRYDHRQAGGAQDYNVGFDNIIGIKQKSMEQGVLRTLEEIQRNRPVSALILYSPALYFLNAAYRFGTAHPEVHICLIVPDLPDFGDLSRQVNLKTRLLQKMQNSVIDRAFSRFNSMVFLTRQTADYLHWTGRPYVVVEGIADVPECPETEQGGVPTIVYTGTTHRQFGVPVLAQAFSLIQDEQVRLVICGQGDYDEELRRMAQRDSRLDFPGVVSHEQALALQQQAAVLVNPRQNIGEYTKYSFPSKTMEYMVTGVPVAAYRLDGMPEEYFDYLNCPKDNSPQALADTITALLHLTPAQRREMGERAKRFVLQEKNPTKQVEKIVRMIRGN